MANKKYKELFYKGKTITDPYKIEEILIKEDMEWFINTETYNVRLEIMNDTLIFNGGTWYNGVWKFGAWRSGDWKCGVWEGGVWFNGVWEEGTFKNGIIYNGTFLKGIFEKVKLRSTNQNGSKTNQTFVDCELPKKPKVV